MHKPMSKEDLKNCQEKDMTLADKALIEVQVHEHVFDEEPIKAAALRGYLVGLCEEVVIDDALRAELPGDAASFSDGWNYCLKYGGQNPVE